jgi:regulator of protease activity HflC (stomatin/prohibitin superfamily)
MQAINYFVAQKYVDALKTFATSANQKTLLLPMETTGILGSLAGITEIAKSVVNDNKPGAA